MDKSHLTEKRKKPSKRTTMIISWWAFIGMALLLGFIGLATAGTANISKDDYQRIEIEYNRIHIQSGEDPMYTIFSKNDERSFLVSNIVSMHFDEGQFAQRVVAGDSIVLTVLKSDYENKTARIKTLGVENDEQIFLNFDTAFKKDFYNGRFGYIMSLVLLPLAGVLVIAFVIWLVLYDKGIVGKKTAEERLAMQTQNSIMVIRFPVSIATIIIYAFTFLCGIGLPLFFISGAPSSAFTALVILCGVITFFNVVSFVMQFLRKLTIDKPNKTLTYFSFFKKTFLADEVLSLDPKEVTDSEGPNRYFLIIGMRSRTIKVKTQSNEQSILLREEIQSLSGLSDEGENDL